MKIDILTLFPEMFAPMRASILGRAQKENKIEINVVNIRDYTEDKHLKVRRLPLRRRCGHGDDGAAHRFGNRGARPRTQGAAHLYVSER